MMRLCVTLKLNFPIPQNSKKELNPIADLTSGKFKLAYYLVCRLTIKFWKYSSLARLPQPELCEYLTKNPYEYR